MRPPYYIRKAYEFAAQAHGSIGQIRRFTGEPYITHPVSVASIVSSITNDHTMISAALLHDTVEDTAVTTDDILSEFGSAIATLVDDLTDISTPEDGDRASRKALDREHTAGASLKAKTIKLADIIHNTRSVTACDPEFAAMYLKEKRLVLDEALLEGNTLLWHSADRIIKLGLTLVDSNVTHPPRQTTTGRNSL